MAEVAPTNEHSIGFDASYVSTPPGMLKVGVIVFSLLGLICNGTVYAYSFGGWYYFHGTTCMITSLVLLILYLVRVPWVVTIIAWYLSELIYCALFCIFYAIGTLGTLISLGTHGYGLAAKIFAAIFGAAATCCLGYDALLKFKAWKRGEVGPAKSRQSVSSPPI